MKLYDFSVFTQRRNEKLAALAVQGVLAKINSPGSVIELKDKMTTWVQLYQQSLKRKSL